MGGKGSEELKKFLPPSPHPVIRECSRMETQMEKKNLLKSASVWSHPRLRILNETQRVSVKIYLHKCCGFFESTGKISWSPSEGFAQSCFKKKLIWKVLQKIHPKGTIIEILSSVTSQPAASLKRNPMRVIFWWLLKRFFRILFCVKALVKQQKELKYSSSCVLEKSWSEELLKIYRKEAMVEPFFN